MARWLAVLALPLFCSTLMPAQSPVLKRTPGVRPCPGLKGALLVKDGGRQAVEVQVKMDVDVDGAPNAYGPHGKKALDIGKHARAPRGSKRPGEIVGYMTEYRGGPPTIQRRGDPYPGYYVSQTSFFDRNNKRLEDPRRYVDASTINYVVLGRLGRQAGVELGDFAVVYSCRTGESAYAIVGDSGNESGAEGSLALVRALGYDIRNGIEDSVGNREIIIRYYPKSNVEEHFFRSQRELDMAATKLGLHK
jgi:hypothetical protein